MLITSTALRTLSLPRASHPDPERVRPVDVDIFSAAWPQGMPVTRSALTYAVALGLDIRWFMALIPLTRAAQAALTRREDDAWIDYVRAEAANKAAYLHANKAGGRLRAVQALYRRARVASLHAWTQAVTEAQIEALLATLGPRDTERAAHTTHDETDTTEPTSGLMDGSQPEPQPYQTRRSTSMAIFQVGESFTATPVWLKPDQTPGKIQGVPKWENPTPTIYNMVVAADELSATGTILVSGAGQIVARADADMGEGVREVIATGEIEVPEAEVTVARMDLTKN